MSFKITIEETRLVEKEVSGDYIKVGEREVKREPQLITPANPQETRIEAIYERPPKTIKEVKETHTVLLQEVDELNLNAVIAAVNNL